MSSPRLCLALEASSRPASLAASRDGAVVTRALSDEREHASDLVPEIAALLGELGARADELDVVIVGLGPGSYTGLRVAAATALGLALGATAARLVGVPSFEAVALGALAPGETGDVLVDARGGQLYHAAYRRDTSEPLALEVVSAPTALAPDEARAALLDAKARHGAGRHATWLADDDALRAAGVAAPPDGVRLVRGARAAAADVLALGLRRLASHGPTPIDGLTPLYLRGFAPKVRAR